MVSFALTEVAFDDCFLLGAGLPVFSDLAELADFTDPATDLFLPVWIDLEDSRPAGFCAAAVNEKIRK